MTAWPFEICFNARDDDCDGVADERDPDFLPTCEMEGWNALGNISGDTGADVQVAGGLGNAWHWATCTENNTQAFGKELHGTVTLENSDAGVDYDVRVYCLACGGHLVVESNAGPGETDVVEFFANDDWFSNDWFNVVLEVVRKDANPTCGEWIMRVYGNLGEGEHWNHVCDRPH